jgi:hypothetical protein
MITKSWFSFVAEMSDTALDTNTISASGNLFRRFHHFLGHPQIQSGRERRKKVGSENVRRFRTRNPRSAGLSVGAVNRIVCAVKSIIAAAWLLGRA